MVSPCTVTRLSVMSGTRWPMLMDAGLLSAVTICGRLKTSNFPSSFKARSMKVKSPPVTAAE